MSTDQKTPADPEHRLAYAPCLRGATLFPASSEAIGDEHIEAEVIIRPRLACLTCSGPPLRAVNGLDSLGSLQKWSVELRPGRT